MVEKKIIKERIRLLVDYPFFGYLALGLQLKEEPEIGTMGTDGEYLLYNPRFVNQLRPEILRTIIAHETLHCALGHLWRKEEREHTKWNFATDYAVNLILQKEGFVLPRGCLYDAKFEGMEAELIYTKLPKLPQGSLMDSHDKWPKEKDKERKEKGEGVSGSREDLQKRWKEKVAQAAMAARIRGNLPGTIAGLVKDILEPKLDWKIILRDVVLSVTKNDFRLIPPSKKHIWRNVYLPSTRGETLEIAIGIDTSGSVSQQEFQEFLAEIKGITEQFTDYTLYLFFCDASIHHQMIITPNEKWPESFPKRGGGTSFIPVFDMIDEENLSVAALVYLTDGNGAYPDSPPEYPVIWVLNSDYPVPWGEKIKMEGRND